MESLVNILYLDHHPDIIGGGQISLLQLIKKLDKKKFKPILVCPQKGELSKEAEQYQVQTIFIPMMSVKSLNILKIINGIRLLRRAIKDKKIAILHVNSSRSMIYAALVSIFCPKPILWHIRITERDYILDRLLKPFAIKIIAISKAVASRFSWMKNQGKIAIIHNGLDLKAFNSFSNLVKVRKAFSLKKNDIVIGTVAMLQPKKGIHILLQAVPLIREDFPQAKFLIVGDDTDSKKHYLQQLRAMTHHFREDKNITFAGFRKDIPELMSALDIFVLPSLIEPFGRVLLEAMAAAKAVVASKVGGIPEIVADEETGILVLPGDSKKLADAIIRLIQDSSLREQMGRKGRKRVEELFSIEKNVELTEQLYIKVLQQQRR